LENPLKTENTFEVENSFEAENLLETETLENPLKAENPLEAESPFDLRNLSSFKSFDILLKLTGHFELSFPVLGSNQPDSYGWIHLSKTADPTSLQRPMRLLFSISSTHITSGRVFAGSIPKSPLPTVDSDLKRSDGNRTRWNRISWRFLIGKNLRKQDWY
jgi:hypothetical protein